MSIKTTFSWAKNPAVIVKELVGNTQVRLFMANEAKKLMNPYVPGDSLIMSKGAKVYVKGAKGIVEYPGPSSRFLYFGKVMIGVHSGSAWAQQGESKKVTGTALHYSKFRHPKATSQWDKAMLVAHKGDLAKAVQNYIKKG